jgi:integrase
MRPKTHLKKRHQKWYVRIHVPTDLRAKLDGKVEYVRSLSTADRAEAERKKHAVIAEFHAYFDELRVGRDGGSRGDVELLRRSYAEAEQQLSHEPLRVDPVSVEDHLSPYDIEQDNLLDEIMRRQRVAETEEIDPNQVPPDLKGRFDALQDYQLRSKGEEPPRRIEYEQKLSEAIGDLEAHQRRGGLKEQTINNYSRHLARFADFLGDKPVLQLTRRDVALFIEELSELSPSYGKAGVDKQLSWKQLYSKYRVDDPDEPRISNKTVNKFLSAVNGLWAHVHRAANEQPPDITWKLHRKKGEDGWREFSSDELVRLFADPVPKDIRNWEILLVGLYTGMRLGEICSLRWGDVEEIDGVTVFDVKASKTAAGVRKVPVHPRLLWLLTRRGPSEQLIWPDLKPGGPDGKLNWYFSKVFTRFRVDRGVEEAGKISFHSARSNVIGQLMAQKAPLDVTQALVGHRRGMTGSKYNRAGYPTGVLKEYLDRLQYPALERFHQRHSAYG